MLLATTPDSFEKAADVENLTSGWFYRYLWFYPNCERPFKPLAQHNVDLLTEEATIREKVSIYWTYFSSHKESAIRFQINPEMMKEYNDWCVDNNNRLRKIGHDPKLAMFSRLQIHTLKLAMIFTIGKRGSLEEADADCMITISNEHMREAIRLVNDYFLPMAFKIYEIVELSESNNDQKRILQTMKQTHGKMQRRDLMRRVRMKSKDFDDAMRQLIHETREIREVEVKNERGSNTIFYLLNKMD
jgi:hypothetical protein